jgi:RND family efflux transporter MFP subunit
MLLVKSKNRKMRNYILPIITAIVISSCGGENTDNLADLKKQQADLKTQLAEISTKISKLEGDSNKKYVLIETSAIVPDFFKTYINVQGRVDAEESVSLSSQMPGTIIKINVKAGDEITKGQILAETDARVLYQSISDLQTSAELVNQLYDKQKSLWDQKIGTEIQYLQAKSQKESMEKKLSTLQEQVRMTKIISPIDGTIDAVDIKLGQLIAPGMPAIRVINFNNLKIKADLAESYASKVHKGDEVIIRFPDSNDTIKAKVSYASRSISPLNRTFGVEIDLDDQKEYHPNQIAIININDYVSKKPVISIPVNYVQKDLKGLYYVFVAANNVVEKKNVILGREYNGLTEVTEGLLATDLLITSGYDGLNEGDAVKIKE